MASKRRRLPAIRAHVRRAINSARLTMRLVRIMDWARGESEQRYRSTK